MPRRSCAFAGMTPKGLCALYGAFDPWPPLCVVVTVELPSGQVEALWLAGIPSHQSEQPKKSDFPPLELQAVCMCTVRNGDEMLPTILGCGYRISSMVENERAWTLVDLGSKVNRQV